MPVVSGLEIGSLGTIFFFGAAALTAVALNSQLD
jgi:hypothetical protein